jgi:hypothetical protein
MRIVETFEKVFCWIIQQDDNRYEGYQVFAFVPECGQPSFQIYHMVYRDGGNGGCVQYGPASDPILDTLDIVAEDNGWVGGVDYSTGCVVDPVEFEQFVQEAITPSNQE